MRKTPQGRGARLQEALEKLRECECLLKKSKAFEKNLSKTVELVDCLTVQGGPAIPVPEGGGEMFITVEKSVELIKSAYLRGIDDTLQGVIGNFSRLEAAVSGQMARDQDAEATRQLLFSPN